MSEHLIQKNRTFNKSEFPWLTVSSLRKLRGNATLVLLSQKVEQVLFCLFVFLNREETLGKDDYGISRDYYKHSKNTF